MDLRRVTGYLALALLALYWLWVLTRTTPVLRRGCRDRTLRLRLTLLRTAAAGWTALFVGTVHFWATSWWHVVVAVPVALAGGVALHRVHRRLVAPPRHRVALARRVRRTGHFQVIRPPGSPGPHRHAAVADPPAAATVPPGPAWPSGPGPVVPGPVVPGPVVPGPAWSTGPGPVGPGPGWVPAQPAAPTGSRSSGSSSAGSATGAVPTSSP